MGRLIGFFLSVLVLFFVFYWERYPILERNLPTGLIVIGAISALIGIGFYWRYKDIFDYEDTSFWGRETNGKQARYILRLFRQTGALLILIGLFFVALIK